MRLTSPDFADNGTIPRRFTADGPNVAPRLEWSDVPPATQSFVLICDDPDAPRGTWVHWVFFGIPAGTAGLPEGGAANGGRQGTNDFRKLGYGGPAPPPGKPHRYFFKLYALDTVLELREGAAKAQVEAAMEGHILAEAQLMGSYGR